MCFRVDFCISLKHVIEIFMEIALKMYIAFRIIAILTMLILPVHEHGRTVHLLMPSSISLSSGL
jgi:hypothetical protein